MLFWKLLVNSYIQDHFSSSCCLYICMVLSKPSVTPLATRWRSRFIARNTLSSVHFSSVQFSRSVLSDSLWPHGLQHARLPSIINSRSLFTPMSIESVMPSNALILCHPLVSCLQSFPTSGSFQMSQLLASGGQRIGVSASPSVLPVNIEDWFPLGWTGRISLQSRGLSRVFSNTRIQKHQFLGAQLSL